MKLRSPSQFFRLASLVLALSGPAALAPVTAHAQQAPAAAKAQYGKALEAMKREDWSEARALLEPLWESMHTYDIAAALGQAEFMLKDHAAGTQHMAFAAANVPLKEKVATVQRIQSALAEMKRSVGTVRFSVSKDSAEVLADGKIVGTSPLATEVYLNPGPHKLEARMSNGASAKEALDVEAGKSYEIALVLGKPSASAVPAVAPAVAAPVEAKQEPPTAIDQPPVRDDKPGPNWVPVMVSGGLAVVAAAVGTGFLLDAKSAKNKAATQLDNAEAEFGPYPCDSPTGGAATSCQELESTLARRDSSVTGATVSFVVGGIFAAGAVGSYFLWRKPSQPRVDASVGPGGASLTLRGSF
jgi:hypothetical protein